MTSATPLGNIIELAYGKGLPVRERREGPVPVYGSNGIAGYHSAAFVEQPTIIVGRKGSVGAVHLVTEPSFPIDTTYFVRRLDPDRVELDYLYHALKHLNLARLATQTGVPGLNREDAYRERIRLPPLDEQRRIVDILNHAASIRRLREQAQAKAREIIPALFLDMFGDPATNPKGWHQAALGDLIAGFEGGKNIQAGSGASSLRILKVSSVTSGVFRPEESKPAPDRYEAPPEHYVRPGDLLFSRANTAELVGATAMVEEVPSDSLLPDKIWRFCWLEPSPVLPIFLFHVLRYPSIRCMMSQMATGTSASMKNISQAKLKTLTIIVPPIHMQQRFVERSETLSAVSRLISSSVSGFDLVASSLLNAYFGRTRNFSDMSASSASATDIKEKESAET
ncbi:MAG: restriction endonuclease subunit S [Rhodospirillales bacterium]|nr:restriction endonuclease subunit S [Rhodospirillales bacterium]MDG4601226.1 restriction endonuclease subunit S [Defluviicoccus sp.]MDG4609182.1 restriction endonuclease subunit S [Defluviicoccus sp.]